MLIVEAKKRKVNPKKVISSGLVPGTEIAKAKLVEKGVIAVEAYEQAFVFAGDERLQLSRGFYEVKSGPVGVLWVYVEKIPIKVGVRRSETAPHNIGAYSDVLTLLVRVDGFAEFLLRKGIVSIQKLKDGDISVGVNELKRELRELLKRALISLAEKGEVTEDLLKDAFKKLIETEASKHDFLPYFALEISTIGLSTRCVNPLAGGD